MFITPSFKKSLIVEQFQGNYLKDVSFILILKLSLRGWNSRIKRDRWETLVGNHKRDQAPVLWAWLTPKKYQF